MSAPMCPRCAGTVALHEGHPSVTSEGHVALWHRDCWNLRDVPLPAAETNAPPASPPQSWRALLSRVSQLSLFLLLQLWRLVRLTGSSLFQLARLSVAGVRGLIARPRLALGLGVTVAVLASGTAIAARYWPVDPTDPLPVVAIARESLVVRSSMPALEDAPPSTRPSNKPIDLSDEIPLVDGKPLDELFPTLKRWIHPVTASPEYMPSFPPRLFGAERGGVERIECGAGHCGVDLDGPRGRPIVAVAAGMLVNVERRELGADGRSGRYVRIQHEDNTFTAYMHLDEVAEGLQVGQAVTRGQYLGTLGATAVYAAVPHLHFSLEVPVTSMKDALGAWVPTRYVNPSPFLMRSTIVPVIERRERPALN
jgi:hypothetical protein